MLTESEPAAVETALMIASCVWIAVEALLRILHPSRLTLRFSIWPFVVLVLSIVVDAGRSAALHRDIDELRVEEGRSHRRGRYDLLRRGRGTGVRDVIAAMRAVCRRS